MNNKTFIQKFRRKVSNDQSTRFNYNSLYANLCTYTEEINIANFQLKSSEITYVFQIKIHRISNSIRMTYM